MNWKRLILITFGFSLIGVVPKFIKNPDFDFQILILYFFYIALCIFSFFTINQFLWTSKADFSYLTRFGVGLFFCFLLLIFFHLLIFNFQPNLLITFLNLNETHFYRILMVTGFRTFVIQSIAFACLFYYKNKDENIAFQQEIDQLNKYLNDLRNNKIERKVYKSTIVTSFQDKVIPINITDIAFFYLTNGIVYQYLFSTQKYIQKETLESFEKDLDPSIFYRANRQFLIHRKAIEKVEQIENRKLKVTLTQPAPEEIVISKAKSSTFIKWLEI